MARSARLLKTDIEQVRKKCVFTTHTPVPAGHDRFSTEQAIRILGGDRTARLERLGCFRDGLLNMTLLALRFSRYANGVAMQHGKVSSEMFPEYVIDTITNGVHATTWMSEPVQKVLDEHIPAWRRDSLYLRNSIDLPEAKILSAHTRSKEALLAEVGSRTGLVLNPHVLTLGFARRAATYKRANLMFTDPERLQKIAASAGGLQILYAGKAHPQDEPGKALIHQVVEDAAKYSNDMLRVVYLEDYAWDLGALLTAGVDVWVNNPRRPYEASGTSGMKAAMNGVPSLSILDGWWIEGCIEGTTGWAIEDGATDDEEAISLYNKLESAVVPTLSGRAGEVGAPDAQHAGLQRILLQHQPHGEAIYAERLLSRAASRARERRRRNLRRLNENFSVVTEQGKSARVRSLRNLREMLVWRVRDGGRMFVQVVRFPSQMFAWKVAFF